MSAKYLVDINLPHHFSIWNKPEYVFQYFINERSKDKDIWNYAKENNLTIITKDRDFSDRILFFVPPPKVIHIRLGNMNIRDFHRIISNVWEEACQLSETHKLVYVFIDRIEAIR